MTAIFLIFLLCFAFSSSEPLSIDCHPDRGATENRCASRGCKWAPKSIPNAPWCEFSNSDDPATMAGYDASGSFQSGPNTVYSAKLQRRPTPTLFGDDYPKATVKIETVTDEILKISIVDQKHKSRKARYPEWKKNLHKSVDFVATESGNDDDSVFDVKMEEKPFGVGVLRRLTGVPLIDTRRIPGFTFAEQYVQVSIRVPTQYVYGLGETTHESLKHDFNYRKWGFLSRDQPPGFGDLNLYGVHPFYICIDDETGNTHGVFFLNTHALNVALQPDPSNPQGGIITFRSIGGAIELFVFSGPTPDDVIRQYTSVIGRPQMPPYWAMGFQLCRYGYKNLTFLNQVFQRNRRAQIPQDVQFIDIDYMYQQMDFTFDDVAFKNLSKFIQSLHNDYQMKMVLIVDPAIASRPPISYDPLTRGLQSGVFIRDNRTGQPLEGKVWPGNTYFPDFTNPATTTWWTSIVKDFHDRQGIEFDGIWIDMNEPSNFVDGSVSKCANTKYNNPPYNPLIYPDMNAKTVCMDADQFAGKHYEFHNLYGFTEAMATYKALQNVFPGKRPFVLSRSTFSGSGKYTNHWTGDNRSLWSHLRLSIIAMLEFNIFGIPMVGADICGFSGETTEELCVRWSQAGAFYPYSRNHNDLDSKKEQDPAAWSENATEIIRDYLLYRYGLLPYLYTLFNQAHVNGTPVARPLFFDFPNDISARNVDDQFLWGSGLMIAPVMDQGATARNVYFPKGRWFWLLYHDEIPDSNRSRLLHNVSMPLTTIGLFIRGGAIIPYQGPAMTTFQSRKNEIVPLVALDENSRACGSLYWDDGESENGPSSFVQFEAWKEGNRGGIRIKLIRNAVEIKPDFNMVQVYGMDSKPSSIALDGNLISPQWISYNEQSKSLSIDHLGIRFDRDHEITWQI